MKMNKQIAMTRKAIQIQRQKAIIRQEMDNKMAKRQNIRTKNGNARRKLRERIRMQGRECALCGKPIDYSLPAGNDWAFEVDEILPVSRGGDPLDINNCQPAHRICNRMKGNGLPRKKKENKTKVQVGQINTSRNWLEE